MKNVLLAFAGIVAGFAGGMIFGRTPKGKEIGDYADEKVKEAREKARKFREKKNENKSENENK